MPSGDFIFSGDSKSIIIVSGVTNVNVQDMYSRWKEWAQVSDNSKYLGAFRTFGGDPTIAGQFAPSYYFLTNGWRVLVDFGEVDFGVNLYTDELEPPVIVGLGSAASIRNSDAVTVDIGVEQSLDYNEKIIVNSLVGVAGTTYPIGTSALPVSNIADALTIANERFIHELHIFGTTIFNVDVHDFVVFGGNIRDVAIFQNVNISGTTFKECVLEGTYDGLIVAEKVQLADGLICGSGYFRDSGLLGKIMVRDGSDFNLLNCSSLVSGSGSPELFLGNDISLNLRKYSGGMAFYDIRSGTTVTAEYLAGNCEIMSGCTGGLIQVRGIAKLTDESSGTTVGTQGLLIPYQIAQQHTINVLTEITKNK